MISCFMINFGKKKLYLSKTKGFSLAEVAIALAIAALVSLPLISVSSGFFERSKYDKTNKSLAAINEALKSYYIMNKALPCPADPSLNPSSASYASPLNCYAASGVAIGAVPVDTLGLSRDFMLDGYGRKFSYVVARRFTSTANIVKFYRNDATKLIVVDDGNDNIITAGNASGTGQQILVNKSDGTNLNDDTIYAILSYGKNGLGSFAENGTKTTSSITNSPASVIPNSVTSFNAPIFTYTNSDSEDDIVLYLQTSGLTATLQDYNYIDCPSKTMTDNDGKNYNYARASASTTAYPTNSNTCGSGVIVQPSTAYCNKNGEWTGFKPQSCSGQGMSSLVVMTTTQRDSAPWSVGTPIFNLTTQRIEVLTSQGWVAASRGGEEYIKFYKHMNVDGNGPGINGCPTTGGCFVNSNSAYQPRSDNLRDGIEIGEDGKPGKWYKAVPEIASRKRVKMIADITMEPGSPGYYWFSLFSKTAPTAASTHTAADGAYAIVLDASDTGATNEVALYYNGQKITSRAIEDQKLDKNQIVFTVEVIVDYNYDTRLARVIVRIPGSGENIYGTLIDYQDTVVRDLSGQYIIVGSNKPNGDSWANYQSMLYDLKVMPFYDY